MQNLPSHSDPSHLPAAVVRSPSGALRNVWPDVLARRKATRFLSRHLKSVDLQSNGKSSPYLGPGRVPTGSLNGFDHLLFLRCSQPSAWDKWAFRGAPFRFRFILHNRNHRIGCNVVCLEKSAQLEGKKEISTAPTCEITTAAGKGLCFPPSDKECVVLPVACRSGPSSLEM